MTEAIGDARPPTHQALGEIIPLRERLWEVLQVMLNDQRQAWDMQPDGSYVQRMPSKDTNGDPAAGLGTHQYLMNLARQRNMRLPQQLEVYGDLNLTDALIRSLPKQLTNDEAMVVQQRMKALGGKNRPPIPAGVDPTRTPRMSRRALRGR